MGHRRVAVTGLGAACGFGLGVAALRTGLLTGQDAVRPIHNISTARLATRTASEIDGFVPADHFSSTQIATYDRVTQLTILAGREAMAEAALSPADLAALGARAGATHAASPGQVTTDENYQAFYERGVQRVPPLSLVRIMGSAPCSALSIEFKTHGPCFGTASACASSTHAIGLAFDMIRSGRIDLCLTGGADASLVPGYIKTWEALRVLTPDKIRPFSADRSGLVLGEAATVLVLEALDHAQARGAPILAELMGFGMSADAADITAPNAQSAASAMRAAIEDAGLVPADIGYINAHGTGTRLNDKTETQALKLLFGSAVPPVSSVKSQIGHCLNAAGGIETIATIIALQEQTLPATINFRAPDPDCDVDCVPNHPRAARVAYALTNSFGFGGVNAVLALRRFAG